MKPLKTFTIVVFCLALLFVASSCAVVVRKDNGKHRGWFKNRNNPHHPRTTNPGIYKGSKEIKLKGKKKKLTAQVVTFDDAYQWQAIKPYKNQDHG